MKITNQTPAFPEIQTPEHYSIGGPTFRQQAALQIMASLYATRFGNNASDYYAREAVRAADALIEELNADYAGDAVETTGLSLFGLNETEQP